MEDQQRVRLIILAISGLLFGAGAYGYFWYQEQKQASQFEDVPLTTAVRPSVKPASTVQLATNTSTATGAAVPAVNMNPAGDTGKAPSAVATPDGTPPGATPNTTTASVTPPAQQPVAATTQPAVKPPAQQPVVAATQPAVTPPAQQPVIKPPAQQPVIKPPAQQPAVATQPAVKPPAQQPAVATQPAVKPPAQQPAVATQPAVKPPVQQASVQPAVKPPAQQPVVAVQPPANPLSVLPGAQPPSADGTTPPVASISVPSKYYPATPAPDAAAQAKMKAGRPDPIEPVLTFLPFPKHRGSVETAAEEALALAPPEKPAPTKINEKLVPPPPPTEAMPGLPGPNAVAGGLPIDQLPVPPSRPTIGDKLRVLGLFDDKAIIAFPKAMQSKNKWPKTITLGTGEQFESITVVGITRDGVTIEEDGERTVKPITTIK